MTAYTEVCSHPTQKIHHDPIALANGCGRSFFDHVWRGKEGSAIAAPSEPTGLDTPDAPSAQILDVFFGLDDALPFAGNLLCGAMVAGMDGIPVTFSRRIAVDNPDVSAFRITTQTGATHTPRCATLRPALGASKRHTVLLVGEFGSDRDPPVRLDIVGSVPLLSGGDAMGLSSERITSLALGPELRIGYRYAPSELPSSSCPPLTLQIVQLTWAGGVTKPGGGELGDAARMRMRVTLSNGVEVTPIALADLGDNDNYTQLCLDTQAPAESVTVEPGVAVDPRGDANPLTTIRITADPETGAATASNLTGHWAKASENGWGLTVSQQGDKLFPNWVTYGSDGKPLWLSMAAGASLQSDGSYTGQLYDFSGIPFNQINNAQAFSSFNIVGQAKISAPSANKLNFDYTVNGISQTKELDRLVFGEPTNCVAAAGSSPATNTNYTDVWNNGVESGWGVHVTHQKDVVFAIWYTYSANGRNQWITAITRSDATGKVFTGPLYRPTAGTPFNLINNTAAATVFPEVGSVRFSFTDGASMQMSYTLDGVTQTKNMTRLQFGASPTRCSRSGSGSGS